MAGSVHSSRDGVKRATQSQKCGACGSRVRLSHRIKKTDQGWVHHPACPEDVQRKQ